MPDPAGGYLLQGTSDSFGTGGQVLWAAHLDGGGEMAWRTLCVVEAGVRQRWLAVHSRAARHRAQELVGRDVDHGRWFAWTSGLAPEKR